MKKLFLFLALASTVAFTSCSKDEDDTDAIVGTWVMEASTTYNGESTSSYEDKWVFKSDLSGDYTEALNGEIDYETSFTWSKSEGSYIVEYSDDDASIDTYTIGDLLGTPTLEEDGYAIALKE
ncbi:lipocalin family protein [Zobellia alginiliquefaciens]|uniref:lipocalin family protein n=1 Tax=Zobellia alginiliquefaciens TaxID=3032586 RepID=UPI0023E46E8C|nr:lipocalin family protein [Zobellia alginiliquefaciens]